VLLIYSFRFYGRRDREPPWQGRSGEYGDCHSEQQRNSPRPDTPLRSGQIERDSNQDQGATEEPGCAGKEEMLDQSAHDSAHDVVLGLSIEDPGHRTVVVQDRVFLLHRS
jgi:hypothetical protein